VVGIGPQSQLNGRTWKKSGKTYAHADGVLVGDRVYTAAAEITNPKE
jgi:hypothetical protein